MDIAVPMDLNAVNRVWYCCIRRDTHFAPDPVVRSSRAHHLRPSFAQIRIAGDSPLGTHRELRANAPGPYDSAPMGAYAVSRAVNSVKNDTEE
jgi:hypothetical protein